MALSEEATAMAVDEGRGRYVKQRDVEGITELTCLDLYLPCSGPRQSIIVYPAQKIAAAAFPLKLGEHEEAHVLLVCSDQL